MKRLFRYLLTCLVLLNSLGIYISNRVMYMRKKDERFIENRETKAGAFHPEEFHKLPKREVDILSTFGYNLKVLVIEPYHTKKYMIFCHGVTENKISSVKYMNLFLKRGFNAVLYDHRRHGDSGGKTTSYGYYEKYDLKTIVDWLKADQGPDLLLGIHGESMGAATMLLYGGMIEDGANFYIADCPFSDFRKQLAYRLKVELKLPSQLFLRMAEFFIKIREGYSLREISPISVIGNIANPVLFIHSAKDDYILPSMTKHLYEKKKGPKKLFIAAKGAHAQSFNENKEEYEQAIDEFLQEYVFSRYPV